MSYTKFQYSDLEINPFVLKKNILKKDDGLVRVSFRVTNTGKRDGAEIAQLYVAPPVHPTVVRPLKELKGFQKIDLQPGKSKKVTIILDGRSLAYYNVSAVTWDVAPGAYRILVGSSSEDIRLQGGLENLFASSLSVLDSTPVPGPQKHAKDLLSTDESTQTKTVATGAPTLTVNSGGGSGQHVAGTFVTVTADPPPAGQQFAGWAGDIQILANPLIPTTTATMPSIDVTITATYADALSSEQSK